MHSKVKMFDFRERNFNSKDIEHYQLNELTCIYKNVDSFMNKYEELISFDI